MFDEETILASILIGIVCGVVLIGFFIKVLWFN